jgi:hypothetical protein
MNIFGFSPAHFTAATRQFSGEFTGGFPAGSASVATASGPSRMSRFANVLRLPFCHAEIIAKGFLRVKITGRSYYVAFTPCTLLCEFVRRFTSLVSALMVAVKRTVNSFQALKALKLIAAGRARFCDGSDFTFESRHGAIISHIEIEEKYCEIAVKRLRQEVLPL